MFRPISLAFAPALVALVACGPRAEPTRPAPAPAEPEPRDAAAVADILARSDLPAELPTPLEGDPMGVTIHRLSNGMTVYVSTDRSVPRVSAWIAVRAGSRHDPARSTGLAHYLEHMLFKGTSSLGTLDIERERPHLERIAELYAELRATDDDARRREILQEIDAATQESAKTSIPNELDSLYAALGITGVNAYTSDEETVYIADVPTNRFAAWARVEGDRFRDPQFRLFLPELEAVYEEKNRTLDDPDYRVYEALMSALFPTHPYGTQPTIGRIEHLKVPAYGDMVEFFHRWYVPNNMAVVLAGDIDAETALPVLEEAFAGLTPKPLDPPAPAEIAPPTGRVERTVVAPGEQSVQLAWQTVPHGHEDRPALEVMDLLVDNARTGILNVELLLPQKLVAASSWGSFQDDAGYWVLSGTAREGQSLEEVERLLAGVIEKLKAGDFTQADIDAILVNQEIRDARQLESTGARVARMTEAFVRRQPWPEAARHTERLRQVSREDVLRVAETYLTNDLVVVERTTGDFEPPVIDKPTITAVALDTSRESELARAVKAMPAEPIEPRWLVEGRDYQRQDLPAGPLVVSPNQQSELFAVRYHWTTGERREPLACHALSLLERSGAGDMDAEALQRALYAMGTSIELSCGDDAITIDVSGLDRHLEDSLALLERWLRQPALERDALAKLTANTIRRRKDRVAEPQVIESALAAFAHRGRQSSYLAQPSNAALRRARLPALRRLITRLPDRAHRTSYFGPRSVQEAAAAVALGKRHAPVAPPEPRRFRRATSPTIFLADKKLSQARVRLLFPAGELAAEDRVLADVYSEYVGGGLGALIAQEIREARGLAYSAWATHHGPQRAGDPVGVLAGLGTQVDKTVEALSTLIALLGEMPLDETRFRVAVRSVEEDLRTSRVEPRHAAAWVYGWDDLGLPGDPRPEKLAGLRQVTPERLAAFAEAQAGAPPVIALLGDTRRLDLEALAQLATIVRVKASELFSY